MDMLTEIAKCISRRRAVRLHGEPRPWEEIHHHMRGAYVITARETLESLLELDPSPEQLEAVRKWSRGKYGRPIGSQAATGCLKVMIKAILDSYEPTHDYAISD